MLTPNEHLTVTVIPNQYNQFLNSMIINTKQSTFDDQFQIDEKRRRTNRAATRMSSFENVDVSFSISSKRMFVAKRRGKKDQIDFADLSLFSREAQTICFNLT